MRGHPAAELRSFSGRGPRGRGGAERGGAGWDRAPPAGPSPAPAARSQPHCRASRDWKIPGWKSPRCAAAVKQKERKENCQSAASAAGRGQSLSTRGGGAAGAAAAEPRRRRRRARPAPLAARPRANRPGVHGEPPPPDPDPSLRRPPALTRTWDFGGGPRRREVSATSPRRPPGRFLGARAVRALHPRAGTGFAAVLAGICGPCVSIVGFPRLGVEVAAPDFGVTALDSSGRLCLSDYAENLNCS